MAFTCSSHHGSFQYLDLHLHRNAFRDIVVPEPLFMHTRMASSDLPPSAKPLPPLPLIPQGPLAERRVRFSPVPLSVTAGPRRHRGPICNRIIDPACGASGTHTTIHSVKISRSTSSPAISHQLSTTMYSSPTSSTRSITARRHRKAMEITPVPPNAYWEDGAIFEEPESPFLLQLFPSSNADFKLDISKVRRNFEVLEQDPKELERLMVLKKYHPLGHASPEDSPFHAALIPPNITHQRITVEFHTDSLHLATWRAHADLGGLIPRVGFLPTLFSIIASELQSKHEWVRQTPPEMPMTSIAHYLVPRNLDMPNTPKITSKAKPIEILILPESMTPILAPEGDQPGDFWKSAFRKVLEPVCGYRHPTMGLCFHSWSNTPDDYKFNGKALPSPLWFLLYALQAAYPGMVIIREEIATETMTRTIERGLPPHGVLVDPACREFFMGLLGRGFEETYEAALDARRSCMTEVTEKVPIPKPAPAPSVRTVRTTGTHPRGASRNRSNSGARVRHYEPLQSAKVPLTDVKNYRDDKHGFFNFKVFLKRTH
ncbi:hypothetical protein FRC03_006311 [Tulasnella sp. 419]|nr:hypothetical protein FRC02_007263 [Tulasnella sp. 418]KAG8960639.1 hypothetical protein FRC03_006311 [Tulasnella sp. 419]